MSKNMWKWINNLWKENVAKKKNALHGKKMTNKFCVEKKTHFTFSTCEKCETKCTMSKKRCVNFR